MLSFESPVRTVWHGIPVGYKFVFLCACSVLLFQIKSPLWQLTALVCCLLMYIAGGLVFTRAGIKRLLFLWPFLLIVLAWHLYSNSISDGLMIVFRLLAIIGLANLVTMTSRLENILDMINRILSPLRRFGINTRPLELAIALLVRFTPVLTNKGSALKDAWCARAVARPGWRLVFPLALQAIDDAENVSEALRARGGVQVQPAYTEAHNQQTSEKS